MPALQTNDRQPRTQMPFTHQPRLAAFAKLTAFVTLVLICAGALITGNKAALSDPTWPKFVGSWLPQKETWVGGLRYEDTHRVIAATTGLLTLALAVWLQVREPRRWLRRLGWWAVALVVAQALFGGLIIHSLRTPWVSMAHACLAQAFFLMVLAIAVVTSRAWATDRPPLDRPGNRSMMLTAKVALGVVYLQLVMGSGVRHSDIPDAPFLLHLVTHILGGILVVCTLAWLLARVRHEYADVAPLRRASTLAGALLVPQVALGIWSIWANRARLAPQMPPFHHILVSTAHVVTGAVILGTTLYVALRAHQLLARREASAPAPSGALAESGA